MKLNDILYGEFDINEPVILELINCPSIKRLNGVSQMGMPKEYYHWPVNFSRFEHSIGVMLLLIKLKAPLKEQIAGLLHDVSHTAFSHVVDWVIGDPSKEDYQDNSLEDSLKNSEIAEILSKYGFDYKGIADIHGDFKLLERSAPDLCADRLDYSLRELIYFIGQEKMSFLINSLINYNNEIIFNNKEAAETFGFGYSKLQEEHWGGYEAMARYHILADALKRALEINLINIKDFSKTDDELLKILSKSNDDHILKCLNLLKNGINVVNSLDKESIILKKKFRYVDPKVLLDGKIYRISEISEEYRINLERLRAKSKNIIKVEILPK